MDSIFERYERLPLGNICDANGKRGSMDQGIRPVDPELRMVGWAYTVRCHPGDNLAIHKAIQEAPAGSVLVVDAGGYTKGGHIGEIMCFACMQRGIRGIVLLPQRHREGNGGGNGSACNLRRGISAKR